jgi:hypothetical protein
MLNIQEIDSISDWLLEASKTLEYGSLSIEIKLSGDRPPLIKRSISEQFLVTNEKIKRSVKAS